MISTDSQYLFPLINLLNQTDDFDQREFSGVEPDANQLLGAEVELPLAFVALMRFLGKRTPIGGLYGWETIVKINQYEKYREMYPIPKDCFFLFRNESDYCIWLNLSTPDPETTIFDENSPEEKNRNFDSFSTFLLEYFKPYCESRQKLIGGRTDLAKAVNEYKKKLLDIEEWALAQKTLDGRSDKQKKLFETICFMVSGLLGRYLELYTELRFEDSWKKKTLERMNMSYLFPHLENENQTQFQELVGQLMEYFQVALAKRE